MEIKTTEKQRAFQICLNSIFIALHMMLLSQKQAKYFMDLIVQFLICMLMSFILYQREMEM